MRKLIIVALLAMLLLPGAVQASSKPPYSPYKKCYTVKYVLHTKGGGHIVIPRQRCIPWEWPR